MITLTYDYYKNVFGGSLSIIAFNSLLPKAQNYLNVYTNYKYKSADEDNLNEEMLSRLKDCTCACIDCLDKNTDNGSLVSEVGNVTSETVGPWSVHKETSSSSVKTASQAFLKTIQLYLSGTSFFVTWA